MESDKHEGKKALMVYYHSLLALVFLQYNLGKIIGETLTGKTLL
jgi:hypothetical protein